jgi:hypothetical protein
VLARDPEKVKAADRARYYRNPEPRRALAHRWQREHPEEVRVAKAEWAARNIDKRRAEWTAGNAVRDGKLIRVEACEACGATGRLHKHHDDYSQPLQVRWLCPACHGVEHRSV